MNIKENRIRGIGHFELDAACIGNKSSSKTEIRLP